MKRDATLIKEESGGDGRDFKAIVDKSSDGIVVLDGEGVVQFANSSAIDLFLSKEGDIIGRNMGLPAGSGDVVELGIVRDGGQMGIVEMRSFEIVWSDEAAILVLLHDITANRVIKYALISEKERLAVTLQSVADGVITADLEGTVVMINDAARYLTGWGRQEAEGSRLAEVFNVTVIDCDSVMEDIIVRVIETGKRERPWHNCILHTRNGNMRYVDIIISPLLDMSGSVFGVVVAFQDVTDKKKMEMEVMRAQKLESIGMLAGGIAHDFNNILTAIMGNITIAMMEDIAEDNTDALKRRLQAAEKACERASALTSQLATLAKGGEPKREVVDIRDMVKESSSFVLAGTDIGIDYLFSDGLWPVYADLGQIGQVISNIVINARHAMPDGGKIEIRVLNRDVNHHHGVSVPEGKYVVVSIKDSGCGIAAENINKIFDPYFTMGHTPTQKGLGLGMAVSHAIIKNHGGLITVESEVDKGTTFLIYLPAVNWKQAMTDVDGVKEDETGVGANGRGGRVLIMDDDDAVSDIIGSALTYFGYEVEVVTDGASALETYKEYKGAGKPFSVVVLDLTVPGGMGGKDVIKQLMAFDPDVKAVICSGYSDIVEMGEYEKYGFRGAVAKPFDIKQMHSELARVINED